MKGKYFRTEHRCVKLNSEKTKLTGLCHRNDGKGKKTEKGNPHTELGQQQVALEAK